MSASKPASRGWHLLPGLALSFALALVAILLRSWSGIAALNPVVVALLLGIAVRGFAGAPATLRPGIAFAVRPLLRAAIVLLGLQVTLGELLALGPEALLLAAAVVALTLGFVLWFGRVLGVDPALSALVGAGTAICGASAVVAAGQVVRGGRESDVAYALAVVTLCGTVALLAFPVLAGPLGMAPRAYGLWAGAAIHEVVQAVGAAAAGGPAATQTGTVMKLARVAMLAPAVLALGWWMAARGAAATAGGVRAPVPWFAFGFLGLVLLGGTGLVPGWAVGASRLLVPVMMATAVAALGLSTDLRALHARGGRPLLLGVAASLFIALLALAGVGLIGEA